MENPNKKQNDPLRDYAAGIAKAIRELKEAIKESRHDPLDDVVKFLGELKDATNQILKKANETIKDGSDGKDGISIDKAQISQQGNLVITLTNGRQVYAGKVVGEDGLDGEDVDEEALVQKILLQLPKPEKFDEEAFLKKIIKEFPESESVENIIEKIKKGKLLSYYDLDDLPNLPEIIHKYTKHLEGRVGGGRYVPGGPFALSRLVDVDTTGLQVNQTLIWNGSYWVPGSGGGGGAIDSVITGGTEHSALFLGPGGILKEDNLNFKYVNSEDTLYVPNITTTPGSDITVKSANHTAPGHLYLRGGNSTNTVADAGSVFTVAGAGFETSSGGNITLTGGAGGLTSGGGGSISLTSGAGGGGGNGGEFNLIAGVGGDSSGNGGTMYFQGGNAGAGNANGGGITFHGGSKSGSGTVGNFKFISGDLLVGDNTTFLSTATPFILDMGGSFGDSVANSYKFKVYNDGTNFAGFGISTNQMNYRTWASTASHVWYQGSTELMRLSGTGSLSITNTTASGQALNVASPYGASLGILRVYSTDTATNNYGGTIELGGNYTGSTYQAFGYIRGAKSDVGGQRGYISFHVGASGATLATESMRLDYTGFLGIGITPDSLLHIRGSNPMFKVQGNGSAQNLVATFYELAAQKASFLFRNSGSENSFELINYTVGPLKFYTASVEVGRFDSTGRFVVGTTASPDSKVSIEGTASSQLKFRRTSVAGVYGYEQGANSFGMYDYTLSNYRWRIDAANLLLQEVTGNVGIGMATAPASKLSIKTATTNATIVTGLRLLNAGTGTNTGTRLSLGLADDEATSASMVGYYDGVTPYFLAWGVELAGTRRLTMAGSGKVVIGTITAPGSYLHLADSNASDTPKADIILSRYYADATDMRGGAIFTYHKAATNIDYLMFGATQDSTASALNRAKFVIGSNGYMGFGTTDPVARVDIRGTTGTAPGTTLIDDDNNFDPRWRMYKWQGAGDIYHVWKTHISPDGAWTWGYSATTTGIGNEAATVDFMNIGFTGLVGINTITQHSYLHVNGSVAYAWRDVTSNVALNALDYYLNTTSGTVTHTVPTAVGIKGRPYMYLNSGSGAVTVATTSGQTISGAASGTIVLNQYDWLELVSDGANWFMTSTGRLYVDSSIGGVGSLTSPLYLNKWREYTNATRDAASWTVGQTIFNTDLYKQQVRNNNSEWETIASGDVLMNKLAPDTNTTITPGYSAYMSDYFEIVSGKVLEIGVGSVLEIG